MKAWAEEGAHEPPGPPVCAQHKVIDMANSPQSRKRIRRNARRAAINTARRSRIRTFIKKVELALASGDKDSATAAFRAAESEIKRGVSKGVLHKNTASRKISRLARRLNALNA